MISPEAKIVDAVTKIIQAHLDDLYTNDPERDLKYKVFQGASAPFELNPSKISVITTGSVAGLDQGRTNANAGYPLQGSDIWTLTLSIMIVTKRDCPNPRNSRSQDGLAKEPIEGKDSIITEIERALKGDHWYDATLFQLKKDEDGEDIPLSPELMELREYIRCHITDCQLATITWEATGVDKHTNTRQDWDIIYRRL